MAQFAFVHCTDPNAGCLHVTVQSTRHADEDGWVWLTVACHDWSRSDVLATFYFHTIGECGLMAPNGDELPGCRAAAEWALRHIGHEPQDCSCYQRRT
jgi:hypothetical protein